MKTKTYVLTVSNVFPKTHKRAGESTGFVGDLINLFSSRKIHTIRANYYLWAERATEINLGHAVLSIRYWSGKPYNSKQIEICRLEYIGVQKLTFFDGNINCPYVYHIDGISNFPVYGSDEIAANDGLTFADFKEWFKNYDLTKPLAIIHFTNFRYHEE